MEYLKLYNGVQRNKNSNLKPYQESLLEAILFTNDSNH